MKINVILVYMLGLMDVFYKKCWKDGYKYYEKQTEEKMGMKRLTYDYEGRHFCDYPTREIINRLAECEIMLEKIEQILKDTPYGGETTVRRIQEVLKNANDD